MVIIVCLSKRDLTQLNDIINHCRETTSTLMLSLLKQQINNINYG